jgi:hypothetical protein
MGGEVKLDRDGLTNGSAVFIDCANERKKEDMKMSMKDRKKMMVRVEDWIGSDASRADLIEIIAQVALGEYTAKQLKEDVLSYDI